MTILKGQATSADDVIADPHATVVLRDEHECEAPCPSNGLPVDADEEAIRALAHGKWEAAGRPAGDGCDFWLEAEQEIKTPRARSHGTAPSMPSSSRDGRQDS